jgi:protease-4
MSGFFGMNKILIAVVLGLVALIGLAFLFSAVLVLSPSFSLFSGKIAVIPVKGSIEAEKSSFVTELSSSEIAEKVQQAAEDPSVAAILLDIDSPGGSIVATKQIVAAVQEAKQSKKVVAWIGDLGASGAYYVAAAGDYIIADADSLTGSIGVISIVTNIEELLKKYGVKVRVLKEGENKAMGSMFEDMNAEQLEIMQEILSNAFKHFKGDIIKFRGERLNRAEFERLSDGRILSGEQALAAGLIDGLGTKQDAIDKAAQLAGIESPTTVDFGKKEASLLELLSSAGYSFGFGVKQGMFESSQPQIQS